MPDTTTQVATTQVTPPPAQPTQKPAGAVAVQPGGAPVDVVAIRKEIEAYDKKAILADNEEPVVGPAPVVDPAKPETQETKTEEKPPEKDDPEDKKLGYYTKWDKTLRAKEAKFEERVKTFEAEYTEKVARANAFEEAVTAIQKDKTLGVDAVLNILGLTYDDIVEAKLAGKLEKKPTEQPAAPAPVDVEQVVEQKIQAIEAKREEAELVALRDEMKAKFDAAITAKADDYANVILNGDLALDAAWQLYVERGQSDQPITEEQALDMVEEALVKQALQAENTKRYKAAKAQPQPKGESERKPANPIPASKLTNSLSTRAPLNVKGLPEADRRKATYDAIAEYDRRMVRERVG